MNDLEYLFGLEQFGIKLGLANIRAILARLDHPERRFRSVHVAGTNGKGSVTAMVDEGLRAAGYRVGRFTSPHLVELNERFVLNGEPVATPAMVDALAAVRAAIDEARQSGTLEVDPTFFEATTALAFELFRRARVDIGVVEVGLGGRLDSTNVLIPVVSAITSIAFDHQQHLGSTLAAIAYEKAGIIKQGVPVVVGPMEPEALAVIEAVAREQHASIVRADEMDIAGRTVVLRGRHQRINAAVAARILQELDRRGVPVGASALDAALTHVVWPGRLDWRSVGGDRAVLFDAAHNAAGAQALADYLREEGLTLPLVFAAMRDKDVADMFAALLPAVASVTLTRASNKRSADPRELAVLASSVAPSLPVTIEASVPAALESAWRTSPRILVAGSIFLLGDVMRHLGLH